MIMSGRQLDSTSTELSINILVGHDSQLSTGDYRMSCSLANKILVPIILRMYSNASIAKHRLWSCCCNFYRLIRALNWVFEKRECSKLNLSVIPWHVKLC